QRRHLADEAVDESVDALACWIEDTGVARPATTDRVRPRSAGVLRIADEPCARMSRHVELGHHSNATIARVCHDFADLCLRVVETVRAHALQFGITFALDANALIVGQMPVQNVELDGGHAVERALDLGYGLEVTAHVDEQSAPLEARRVGDADIGDEVMLRVAVDELEDGLESADHTDSRRRLQSQGAVAARERVRFILVDTLHSFAGA